MKIHDLEIEIPYTVSTPLHTEVPVVVRTRTSYKLYRDRLGWLSATPTPLGNSPALKQKKVEAVDTYNQMASDYNFAVRRYEETARSMQALIQELGAQVSALRERKRQYDDALEQKAQKRNTLGSIQSALEGEIGHTEQSSGLSALQDLVAFLGASPANEAKAIAMGLDVAGVRKTLSDYQELR